MGTLDGKVAIVTGGAGALGAAVVLAMLEAGMAVVVPHHAAGELDTLRERMRIPAGAKLEGTALDLTDEQAVASYYTAVAERHGGIDVLVNIAGGFGGGAPVHETPW